MANKIAHSRGFKRLHVTVLGKDEVNLALNEIDMELYNSTAYCLPISAKPRKLAKELRKIARWLEKQ